MGDWQCASNEFTTTPRETLGDGGRRRVDPVQTRRDGNGISLRQSLGLTPKTSSVAQPLERKLVFVQAVELEAALARPHSGTIACAVSVVTLRLGTLRIFDLVGRKSPSIKLFEC